MTRGCVRAWGEEERRAASGALRTRHDTALFRRGFRTALRQTASDTGTAIRDLEWGRAVELLDWPSGAPWTRIRAGADEGFVRTEHLERILMIAINHWGNRVERELGLHDVSFQFDPFADENRGPPARCYFVRLGGPSKCRWPDRGKWRQNAAS